MFADKIFGGPVAGLGACNYSHMQLRRTDEHLVMHDGALYLTDDLKVMNPMTGATVGPLRVHPQHTVDIQYIQKHRSYWSQDT